MKVLNRIAIILLLISGLNWGLVGLADFNIFMWILFDMRIAQHLLYILFGIAALYNIVFCLKLATYRNSN